jgi:hypothetical protein
MLMTRTLNDTNAILLCRIYSEFMKQYNKPWCSVDTKNVSDKVEVVFFMATTIEFRWAHTGFEFYIVVINVRLLADREQLFG